MQGFNRPVKLNLSDKPKWMMHLIIIENSDCREELNRFLTAHNKSIRLNIELEKGDYKVGRFLENINTICARDKKLVINSSDSILLLNVKDIVRCESKRNYTVIYFNNKKELLVAKTLREFEEILEAYRFFRIHRSHLININYIDKYVKNKGFVLLQNGDQVHLSQRKRESFLKLLEKL